MTNSARGWILAGTAVVAVVATFTIAAPFPQYPSYFQLADDRTLLNVPRALDVLSNLAYLLVGIAGLLQISRQSPGAAHILHYRILFGGFVLTAIGSAYFHWSPSNETLTWDRLPMTILFMAFFASMISELVDPGLARRLLPVLLSVGIGSVIYWAYTEAQGNGDLRLYGLVQFLPVVLILQMISLYEKPAGYGEAVAFLLFGYAAAKLFEHFDHEIYRALGSAVSGHTLKHLISGTSGLFLVFWLRQRNEAPG